MALRPVFVTKSSWPFYTETEVSFKYYAGFALVQRQKNIAGIHEAFLKLDPSARVLEASSKAPTALGKSLSPFYLMSDYEGQAYPVECIFQAIKVFQHGGPFWQLLNFEPVKAKTTSLTKNAGALLYYEYHNERYPLDPKGWMYNWIYMKALQNHPDLVSQILDYNAFTDIAFNPKTGSTCQAKALAIYKGLMKKGLLEEALSSIPAFLKIVYHEKNDYKPNGKKPMEKEEALLTQSSQSQTTSEPGQPIEDTDQLQD